MSQQQDAQTLADGLEREIERAQELLAAYRSIPTGGFGAAVIQDVLKRAKRAILQGDLPGMRCSMITYSTSNHPDDGLLVWLDMPDGNRILLGNISSDDGEDLEAIAEALDMLVSYYPDETMEDAA